MANANPRNMDSVSSISSKQESSEKEIKSESIKKEEGPFSEMEKPAEISISREENKVYPDKNVQEFDQNTNKLESDGEADGKINELVEKSNDVVDKSSEDNSLENNATDDGNAHQSAGNLTDQQPNTSKPIIQEVSSPNIIHSLQPDMKIPQSDKGNDANKPLETAVLDEKTPGKEESQPYNEQDIDKDRPLDLGVVKTEESPRKPEKKNADIKIEDKTGGGINISSEQLEGDLSKRLEGINLQSSMPDEKQQTSPENILENSIDGQQQQNEKEKISDSKKEELVDLKKQPITNRDGVEKEKVTDSHAKDDVKEKKEIVKDEADLENSSKAATKELKEKNLDVKKEKTKDLPQKEEEAVDNLQDREHPIELKVKIGAPKENIKEPAEETHTEDKGKNKKFLEKEQAKNISDDVEDKKNELEDHHLKKNNQPSMGSKISENPVVVTRPTLKARDWTSRQPVENDETVDLKAGLNRPPSLPVTKTTIPDQPKTKQMPPPPVIRTRPPIASSKGGAVPLRIITDVKASSVKVSHSTSTTVVDQLGTKFGHLGISARKETTTPHGVTKQMEKLTIIDGHNSTTKIVQRLEHVEKPCDKKKYTARGETAPGDSSCSQSESPLRVCQVGSGQQIPSQPEQQAAFARALAASTFPSQFFTAHTVVGKKRHIDDSHVLYSTKRFESANGYPEGNGGLNGNQNSLSYSENLLDDISDSSSAGILYNIALVSSHSSSPLSNLDASPPPSPTLLEPISEIQEMLKSFSDNIVGEANLALLGVASPQGSETTQQGSPQSFVTSSQSPASQPLSPLQYQQHESPAYQQQGSPVYQQQQQQGSPSNQQRSPLYQQQESPAYQQQGSPVYQPQQQQGSPSNQQRSPLYQQQESPAYQQQGSPVYQPQQQQGSPSNQQRSPLQPPMNSPQYYRTPSPAGSAHSGTPSPSQAAAQVTYPQQVSPSPQSTFVSATGGNNFGLVEVKKSAASVAPLMHFTVSPPPVSTGASPYPKSVQVSVSNRPAPAPVPAKQPSGGYNRQLSSVYMPSNVPNPFVPQQQPAPAPGSFPASCRYSATVSVGPPASQLQPELVPFKVATSSAAQPYVKPEQPNSSLQKQQQLQLQQQQQFQHQQQPQRQHLRQWPPQSQNVSTSYTREQLLGQDEDGDTYLHIAISQGNIELAKIIASEMYKYDASSINKADLLGQTPLAVAMVVGYDKLVEHLLKLGADPDPVTREGNRPLHLAVRYGHYGCVYAFANNTGNYNIDIDAKNYEGLTALHLAVIENKKKKELEDSKKIIVDNRQCVELLIEMGASPFCEDGKSGKTPLHYAVEQLDHDLVRIILDNTEDSAKLTNCTTYSGNTALHIVVGIPNKDEEVLLQIIYLLMRHGANVGLQNSDKQPPIALVDSHHNEIKKKLKSGQTGITVNGQPNNGARFSN